MQLNLDGICVHIHRIGSSTHLIALPAANGYSVDDNNGRPIAIPNHMASLTINVADVDASDPDAAVATFETGGGLQRLPSPTNIASWKLSGVTVGCDVANAFAIEPVGCVPSLTAKAVVTIRPEVERGEPSEHVAAYVELNGGQLTGWMEKLGGRHTFLRTAEQSWQLTVRRGATKRTLPMKGTAVVFVRNSEESPCNPCSEVDYLLHYRLTVPSWVPSSAFDAPDCEGEPVEVTPPERSTLLSCSNSNYP